MWITFLVWLSSAILPFSIFYLVGFGVLAKRPVFDDFLAGAAKGMKTTMEIFPTLAALLVSVRILRVSGFLEFLGKVLKAPAMVFHVPQELVPVALFRLVSNSAATGLMLDIFKEQGPDSRLGVMASLLLSSTETVFYCLSIYFGSIGIRRSRYTLPGALLATGVGMGVSIWLGGLFYA